MNILSGTRNLEYNPAFREGNFKVLDLTGAIETATKITQIAPYFKSYYRRNFVNAMIISFKNPVYNHNHGYFLSPT